MIVLNKICKRCKVKKPAKAFKRNNLKKDGRNDYCIICDYQIFGIKMPEYSNTFIK